MPYHEYRPNATTNYDIATLWGNRAKEKRIGLEDEKKSGLFLQCKRVLDEVKPKWFFIENVASMGESNRAKLTELIGIESVRVDGKFYSAANRNRLYWTNIPDRRIGCENPPTLNDIVDEGWWSPNEKAGSLLSRDEGIFGCTPKRIVHRYFNTSFLTILFRSREHYEECKAEYVRQTHGLKVHGSSSLTNAECWKNVRILNKRERAICSSIPFKYVEFLTEKQAANLIGDGWQVDVVVDLFRGMLTGKTKADEPKKGLKKFFD